MYWPTAAARAHLLPPPLEHDPAHTIKPSRRGNLFATLGKAAIAVWDVRPTVLQGAVVRTPQSLERWGENQDVFWAHDGRALIVLTTTAHLLLYNLVPTAGSSYSPPPTPFPPGHGPGEAPPLQAYTLVSLGVAFAMGLAQSVLLQAHSLLLPLRHPPSLVSVPWPIPAELLTPPGSHFPPAPLDGETEAQVGIDVWELAKGRDWIDYDGGPCPENRTNSRSSASTARRVAQPDTRSANSLHAPVRGWPGIRIPPSSPNPTRANQRWLAIAAAPSDILLPSTPNEIHGLSDSPHTCAGPVTCAGRRSARPRRCAAGCAGRRTSRRRLSQPASGPSRRWSDQWSRPCRDSTECRRASTIPHAQPTAFCERCDVAGTRAHPLMDL